MWGVLVAVLLSLGSSYLQRTTGLIPASSDRTFMAWVKQTTLPTGVQFNTLLASIDSLVSYTDYGAMFSTGPDGRTYVELEKGATTQDTPTHLPTAGKYYHYVWTYTASTHVAQLWVSGTVIGSATLNINAATFGIDVLGGDSFGIGGITVAQCRQWNAVLTSDEILAEMQSPTAVKTANLWLDTPLASNLNDVSGNGRNWTQVGSGSFVSGPTYPSNVSIATATDLGTLPNTITQNFGDGIYGWYTYTPAVSNEYVMGLFASATLGDSLRLRVYLADGSLYPSSAQIDATNLPVQVPLLSATPVYFYVLATAPPTTTVTISALPGPTNAAPAGTLLINDDTADYPLAMLDPASGLPLRFLNPYPNGETVGVLNTGAFLLDDKASAVLRLYDSTLTQTGTVAYPWGDTTLVGTITSDRASTYYVCKNAGTAVYKLTSAGVLSHTYTVAASVSIMCPSRDNAILYYMHGGTNQAVKRWDLVNDVALADLAAGVANHFGTNTLLTLADNTILVGYGKSTATADYFVRHYSAAGAVLNTYTLADPTEKINWIQLGLTDDSSQFLVWSFPVSPSGSSRFTYLKVSDGSTLSTAGPVPQYEEGVYSETATLTPTARFGHSLSCPIWVLASSITPAPTGTATEYLIRRERWFPHLSSEQFRQFFLMLQIDLQAGNGIPSGQGSDPVMEIDWSDDGGWTWSNVHFVSTGKVGDFRRRAILRRMGYGRDRIYRIAVSDPVQWVVVNGWLQAVLGTS